MKKMNWFFAKVYAYMLLATVIFWGHIEYGLKWITNRNGLRSKSKEERRKEYEKCFSLWAESFGCQCKINWKEP